MHLYKCAFANALLHTWIHRHERAHTHSPRHSCACSLKVLFAVVGLVVASVASATAPSTSVGEKNSKAANRLGEEGRADVRLLMRAERQLPKLLRLLVAPLGFRASRPSKENFPLLFTPTSSPSPVAPRSVRLLEGLLRRCCERTESCCNSWCSCCLGGRARQNSKPPTLPIFVPTAELSTSSCIPSRFT